jgi:hypothetical protein
MSPVLKVLPVKKMVLDLFDNDKYEKERQQNSARFNQIPGDPLQRWQMKTKFTKNPISQ